MMPRVIREEFRLSIERPGVFDGTPAHRASFFDPIRHRMFPPRFILEHRGCLAVGAERIEQD